MRFQNPHYLGSRGGPKRREAGMATVLFIALLTIMLLLVMAESQALFTLHREVKLLEQQQIKRLNPSPTNQVSIVTRERK